MMNLITTQLALLLLHVAVSSTASSADAPQLWVHNCSSTDGNYTTSSPYKTNLDTLFNEALTTNLDSGFYNLSAGDGQSLDATYLISLCVGNIDVSGCHTCQNFVINTTKTLCPNQKTAIAWSDDCFVRYSNKPIFKILEEQPSFLMLRNLKASDETLEEYSNLVSKLLDGLPGNASAGDSRVKFASGKAEFNSTLTIYAAVQCTPDLTQKECLDCLDVANNEIQSCPDCKGQRGARVLLPSCMVRYEEHKFYLSVDSPVPITSPSPGGNDTSVNAGRSSIMAIIVVRACLLSTLF